MVDLIDKKFFLDYNKVMTEKQEWLRKKLSFAERIGVIKQSQKLLERELQWSKTLGGINMNSQIINSLNQMTLEELEDFKTEVSNYIREKKIDQKENAKIMFEKNVSIGDEVSFIFKGSEVQGEVVKINEKSFTAIFNWEGEEVKKPIQFHLYRNSVFETTQTEISEEILEEKVAF